jgi:hypothetical protein
VAGLVPGKSALVGPKACLQPSFHTQHVFICSASHSSLLLAGWLAGCVQDTITAAGYVLHMGSKPAGELKVGDSVTSK